MSSPLRFLAAAVLIWVGVRAAGGTLLPEPLAAVPLPPPQTPLLDTQLAYAEPAPMAQQQPAYPAMAGYPPPPSYYGAMPMMRPQPYPVPVYYPVPQPHAAFAPALPPMSYAPLPELSDEPRLALLDVWPGQGPVSGAARHDAPGTPSFTPAAVTPRFDRLSLTSWALMRQTQPMLSPQSPSLSPTGTLGGSQAGLRLAYNFNPRLGVNLRLSGPADRREFAGEAALGISWQPLQSIPVRLMAERRHAIGEGAGRNAFALLAEGGIYDRPLPWQFRLDGYAQAGIVGARSRDLFADGGVTVTRPLLGRFALGAGAWGGVQPGLSRIDVGPRLSLRVNPRIRAHLDYRYKVIGNALPGSGPAITLAGDF